MSKILKMCEAGKSALMSSMHKISIYGIVANKSSQFEHGDTVVMYVFTSLFTYVYCCRIPYVVFHISEAKAHSLDAESTVILIPVIPTVKRTPF